MSDEDAIPVTRAQYDAMFGAGTDDAIPISRAAYEAKFAAPAAAPEESSLLGSIGRSIVGDNWQAPSSIGEALGNFGRNITSSDFWLTRPSGERITAAQGVAGPALNTLNSMAFNLGDEATAGGAAVLDALGGKDFAPSYDERLAQARGAVTDFRNASPGTAFMLDLAGASKMPIPDIMSKASGLKSAAGNIAKGAGLNSLLGALYGFGGGEGTDNRLSDAGTVGTMSGVLGGGLTAGAELLSGAKNLISRIREPFTDAGQSRVAADILRKSANDPNLSNTLDAELAASVNDPFLPYKSTAELTDSTGLASLEKALLRENMGEADAANVLAGKRADIRQQLAQQMAPDGPGAVALQDEIGNRIEHALSVANAADNNLPVNAPASATGSVIRGALQEADREGRTLIDQAYELVPNQRKPLGALDLRDAVDAVERKYYGPGYKDVPSDLRTLADSVRELAPGTVSRPALDPTAQMLANIRGASPAAAPADNVTFEYLSNARRLASDLGRKYQAMPEGKAGAAFAGELKGIINNGINDVLPPEMAAPYQRAIELRRAHGEQFQQGAPARVLQRGMGENGFTMNASNVGKTFWGSSPESMTQFQRALGGNQEARAALVQDAVTDLRASGMKPDGSFDLAGYQRWTRDNQQFLEAFPGARSQIEAVARSQGAAKELEGNFRQFLDADPSLAVSTVLSGKNPTTKMRELADIASSSPELKDNLRRGIIDHMVNSTTDINGKFLNKKFNDFVDKYEPALKEVFTPSHLRTLRTIADDLSGEARAAANATTLSKGQSATEQNRSVAQEIKDQVLKQLGKAGSVLSTEKGRAKATVAASVMGFFFGGGLGAAGSGVVVGSAGKLGSAMINEAASKVNAKLLQAARDPQFASMLLKTATPQRQQTALAYLSQKIASKMPPILDSAVRGPDQQSDTKTPSTTAQPAQQLPEKSSYRESPSSDAANQDTFKGIKLDIGTAMDKAQTKMNGQTPEKIRQVEAQIDQDPYYSALYEAESGRNPYAKNPDTTASGAFQFVKKTAKSLGLADPFDIEASFEKVRQLTDAHAKRFGDDPAALYSAHYLGATVFNKLRKGEKLSRDEQKQVDYLEQKALPDFMKIYNRVRTKQVEA